MVMFVSLIRTFKKKKIELSDLLIVVKSGLVFFLTEDVYIWDV